MPSLTGLQVVTEAFQILNVFLPGEPIPAADAQVGRVALNRLLSQWRTRRLFIPIQVRERFDLVSGQGGPDNPYTIGPGGDFDTERPATQNSLLSANLILTNSNPEVRVALGIYTNDAYNANAIPDQPSEQPTGLYYNPTYASGWGSIYLWPVPNTAQNDLEIFVTRPLASFDDLATEHDVPDGADDALVYSLARRLAGRYGRTMTPDDRQQAVASVNAFQRGNVQLADLASDAAWATYGRPTLYNIQTGS